MPGNPQRPTPKQPMPEKPRGPASDPSVLNNPNGPIEDPPSSGQKPGDDQRRDQPPATNS